ncbi:uncharacterized protein BX663DRAFT_445147 [Cokeromyces recurvatus]|uniref:uncharacterized protein n=1 Tax=Cokeromyces recurvatus TaxID=90255 RepID=UPI00221F885A|nr:uncharacterized protein BX663DRAFT_445147 [Cokeromyces recurvatus]KAI7907450.1 hypothetical protein BX663DRAFT_445147 [Cokeromyces recurvatus]
MVYNDYEESFASAPVRYALDDHDSDEELEASVQNQKITVEINLAMVTKEDDDTKWTIVIGPEGPGSVYINSLEGQSTTAIGLITRLFEGTHPEIKATIYQLVKQPILLIPFTTQIPPEEASLYTKSILNSFSGKMDKVIVLDSFTTTGYITKDYNENLAPPFLRILQTTTAPIVKGLAPYECPNIIKGFTASLISYCEMHSIPCYNLLTLQESVYAALLITTETLEAYNIGLRQLGLDFSFNEHLMRKILKTRHTGRIDDNHHRLYL